MTLNALKFNDFTLLGLKGLTFESLYPYISLLVCQYICRISRSYSYV